MGSRSPDLHMIAIAYTGRKPIPPAIAVALFVAVLGWTVGRVPPELGGVPQSATVTGAAASPHLVADSSAPQLSAILVPVAVPASPSFELFPEFTNTTSGRDRSQLRPSSLSHDVSKSHGAQSFVSRPLRL